MAHGTQDFSIRSAGLLLSYWCSARCAHCYELSGPGRPGWMDLQDARSHLAALARLGADWSEVHVGGGEPFGNYDLLLATVRAAPGAGLAGLGYVETNAFWATDEAVVRTRLVELRDAGLGQISISADPFHQAFVDPACVTRLWEAARAALGERRVRGRRWRYVKAPVDLRSADQAALQSAYRAALSEFPERLTGRAARELADMLPRQPTAAFADLNCQESLARSGHVHIDLHGHVFPGTCVGLILGRATVATPLDAVLAAARRPARMGGQVWRTLTERGPCGLAALAAERGYQLDARGYADKCHLCYSVRMFLFQHGHFVEELGPREVYEET